MSLTSEVPIRPSPYSEEVKPTVGEQCTSLLCRQWREEPAPKLKTELYNQCVDPLPPPHPDLSNPPSFILSYLIKCFLSLQDPQPSHQEGCQPQRNSFPVLTGLPGKASGQGEKSSMAISWPDHLLVQSQQSSREQLLRDKFSTHQGSPSPSASGHFYETHEKHEASGSKPGMPGCPGCQDVQDARMPSPGPWSQVWPTESPRGDSA